jgi:2Fe-2S ferredoxin
MQMYTIKFNFEQKGFRPVTLNDIKAGQTILEIALGHDIDLNHNCGGVCSCTTCHVYIEKGMEFIDEMSKREKDFIATVTKSRPNSRLACQSLLLEDNNEIEITIPEQRQFFEE